MYYIESLIWKTLIDDGNEKEDFLFVQDRELQPEISEPVGPLTPSNIFDQPILASSFKSVVSSDLYAILKQLDADAASGLHPHEKRKVIRSLQVMQRLKTKYSDVLRDQQSQAGGSRFGGSIRFPDAVIFWTQTEQSVLDQRLDNRVDEMLERGLLHELESFHSEYSVKRTEHGLKPDYTQGIFQAIGFKEFHEYLMLPPEKRTEKLFSKCVHNMKVRTRVYAKKQIKWINNRMVQACERQIPSIFAVDTSDPRDWEDAVQMRSLQILTHLREESELPIHLQPLPRSERPAEMRNEKGLRYCDVCDRQFQGTFQYNSHINSRRHNDMRSQKQKEAATVNG